jgi:hypothetical protein
MPGLPPGDVGRRVRRVAGACSKAGYPKPERTRVFPPMRTERPRIFRVSRVIRAIADLRHTVE